MKYKKKLGFLGEQIVKNHLILKHFSYVQSNYLKRFGEIDLILQKDGKWHFFEVKTVSREMLKLDVTCETSLHRPEENVSRLKLRKIGRAVQTYISENGLEDSSWQFNVACVYFDNKNSKVYIKFLWDIILEA